MRTGFADAFSRTPWQFRERPCGLLVCLDASAAESAKRSRRQRRHFGLAALNAPAPTWRDPPRISA
jgi:hypothetical protein